MYSNNLIYHFKNTSSRSNGKANFIFHIIVNYFADINENVMAFNMSFICTQPYC